MEVKIIKKISFKEIRRQLLQVTILKSLSHPYQNSSISLREFCPVDEIKPSALYVLKTKLNFHRRLRQEFLKVFEIDILNLEYGIEYKYEEGNHILFPPIVEETAEGNIICDGMHRTFIAKEIGSKVKCIHVSSSSVPFPCLPVQWEDVQQENNVPSLKRVPRPGWTDTLENRYSLYRDFSKIGLGGPRKIGSS